MERSGIPNLVRGDKIQIREGWEDFGKQGEVLAAPLWINQWWVPIQWLDDCDPDIHKAAGLEKFVVQELPVSDRMKLDDLLIACNIATTRLGIICEHGGTMREFLNAGSMCEIQAAVTAIEK